MKSPDVSVDRPLFRTFWMGGFEGADHVNSHGHGLSLNSSNAHWDALDHDYALLAGFGIRTVRESIGWRASHTADGLDLRRLAAHAQAARRHGVQVVWTFSHYGLPAGVDLFAADFPGRFAEFCEQVARCLKPLTEGPPIWQPVNEISFLSWAASATRLIHPYAGDSPVRGYELKCNLVRAALAGCDALWSVDPGARIVHTDPVIHVIAAPGASIEEHAEAAQLSQLQFQAWDMLCGRLEPGLGGAPRYLDVLGINYYHSNQWEYPTHERLHWHLDDPRRRDLSDLLEAVWRRYSRPMFIAETSHVGEGRARWLDHVGSEALRCEQRGIPLEGICLYPVVDRPDWEDASHWHRSGLWDVPDPANAPSARVLNEPYAECLRRWQQALPCRAAPRIAAIDRHRGGPPDLMPDRFPFTSSPLLHRGTPMPTLVVFSHLRWDFVYQRPQQLLSRLAQKFPVVFVEEPVPGAAEARLERLSPVAGVEVLRPHLPGPAHGFHDDHIPALRILLADYLAEQKLERYWLWFYTPMAMPLAAELTPEGIVYDCMDELAAFKNAPRQLLQRENALFKAADLVFTGGRSLYESKRERHASVHCFPSSVDAAHFARAQQTDGPDHPAQSHIARPRLGFFGVIDERIDLPLVAALADARPEWQVVMVGPVVKIDPATLPQRANLHWLGQRSYAELPELIAGWDVCLLPFALNDSTRFISPTKTLEYLAADRPAVSTPIKDVVEPYGGIVAIAASPEAFIAACDAALQRTPQQREDDAKARAAVVAGTSWDRTAADMGRLIEEAAGAKAKPTRVPAGEAVRPARGAAALGAPANDGSGYDTVILGAGPTGLAAALHAGPGSLLLEKNAQVGGWCRSIEDGGFTFDYAGHIMFSNDAYVLQLYERLLGANLHWQNREAWVYSKSVYTRYPFQGALYGLPPEVLKECLVGAIEARFGPLKKPDLRVSPTGPSRAAGALTTASDATPARTGASAGASGSATATTASAAQQPPKNFEEFIYKVWGAGVAKHFAIPYNKKLWAVPLSEMETSWLGGRVPLPDLEEMIEGALQPVGKPMGPNARFGYPLRGGFQAMMEGFLPLLEGDMELEAKIVAVSPSKKTVTLADGRQFRFNTLISTMPLPRLVEAMGSEAPDFVREAARQLRHVSVRCVNLGIGRADITDKHWIYYPEDTVFHRIFVQGNASPHCNAPGGFGLTCEITYSPHKPLPAEGEALIRRCIDDCIRVGIIRADDPVWVANEVDMPYAYVVYDHARAALVQSIRDWMAQANILLAGRYSEWEYYNSDHAFVAGRKAAELAAELNEAPAALPSSAVA